MLMLGWINHNYFQKKIRLICYIFSAFNQLNDYVFYFTPFLLF